MSNRRIVHVDMPAKDRKSACEFYEKAFDWGNAMHMDDFKYSAFCTGNTGIGVQDISDDRQPGSVFIYIRSEDLAADLKAIEANGGKILAEPMPIPGGAIALFADPTGNTLGLSYSDGSMPDEPPYAGRPFVHVEIPASDRQAAAKFYETIFGWETQHFDDYHYTTFKTGENSMGGGFAEVGEYAKVGDVIVFVESEDLAADTEKMNDLGATVLGEPIEVPAMGHFLHWLDTTGNRLAFWKNA